LTEDKFVCQQYLVDLYNVCVCLMCMRNKTGLFDISVLFVQHTAHIAQLHTVIYIVKRNVSRKITHNFRYICTFTSKYTIINAIMSTKST